MKNTNVKVVTFGVFDSTLKYKPKARILYSTEERIEILKQFY